MPSAHAGLAVEGLTDDRGNAQKLVVFTVTDPSNGNATVQLYTDATRATPRSTPYYTDNRGNAVVWAEPGLYTLTVPSTGATYPLNVVPDPADLVNAGSDPTAVHLAGTETVTGAKNFTGGLTKSGVTVATTTDITTALSSLDVTGQYLGSSSTFSGLPTTDAQGHAAGNGDWAGLTADVVGTGTSDNPQYPEGAYAYNGSAFSLAFRVSAVDGSAYEPAGSVATEATRAQAAEALKLNKAGDTASGDILGTGFPVLSSQGGRASSAAVPTTMPMTRLPATKRSYTKADILLSSDPWGYEQDSWGRHRSVENDNVWGVKFVKLRSLSAASPIAQVQWYVDDSGLIAGNTASGSAVDTQTSAPYALGGVDSLGAMNGYDFSALPNDQTFHYLSAVITFTDGHTSTLTAKYYLCNTAYDFMTYLALAGGGLPTSLPRGRYIAYQSDNTTHATPLVLLANQGPVDIEGLLYLQGGNLTIRGQWRARQGITVKGGNNYTLTGDDVWNCELTSPWWWNIDSPSFKSRYKVKTVKYATTSGPLPTTGGTLTVPGITFNDGDRILRCATDHFDQNGLWNYNSTGPWTRTTDADAAGELPQWQMVVPDQDTNVRYIWVLTTPGVTPGTTNQTWKYIRPSTQGLNVNNGTAGTYQSSTISNVVLRDAWVHDIVEDGIFLTHTTDVTIENVRVDRVLDWRKNRHYDGIQFGGDNLRTTMRNVDVPNILCKSDYGPIDQTTYDHVFVHDQFSGRYGLDEVSSSNAGTVPGNAGTISNTLYRDTRAWGNAFYDFHLTTNGDGSSRVNVTLDGLTYSNRVAGGQPSVPTEYQYRPRPISPVEVVNQSASGVTSIAVNRPSGLAPGANGAFLFLLFVDDATATVTPPDTASVRAGNPTTLVGDSGAGGASGMRCFGYHFAFQTFAANAGPYTFTFSKSVNVRVFVYSVLNVPSDATAVEKIVFNQQAAASTATFPAVTTKRSNRLVSWFAAARNVPFASPWGVPDNLATAVSQVAIAAPANGGAWTPGVVAVKGSYWTYSGSTYLNNAENNTSVPGGSGWVAVTSPNDAGMTLWGAVLPFSPNTPVGTLGPFNLSTPASTDVLTVGVVWAPADDKSPPRDVAIPGLRADAIPVTPTTELPWANLQQALDGSYASLVGQIATSSSKVYAGTGAPSSLLGKDSDYYFDRTPGAVALYGPKSGSSWGSPTSLTGATGATGPGNSASPSLMRSGAIAEAFPRYGAAMSGQGGSVSGRAQGGFIHLTAGQVINWIEFQASAAGTLTNLWYFLADSAGNKLAVTSDNGSTGFGTTPFTTRLNLASPYTVPSTGRYAVGIVQVGTVVNVKGVTNDSGVTNLAPALCFADTAHAGLTNPASAPTTFTYSTSTIPNQQFWFAVG